MKSVSGSEISQIKMATNPPDVIVNAGMRVINVKDNFIYEYVDIGWVQSHEATREDYDNIPQLVG